MNLNYREENVDRFVEIVATAQKFNRPFTFRMFNAPEGYMEFIRAFGLSYLYDDHTPDEIYIKGEKDDLYIECVKRIPLNKVFRTFEPIEEIEKRIKTYSFTETKSLDLASEQLLKNAAEKLNYTTDNLINCVNLAEVIASMENSTIKAQHIAEACQYVLIL